MSIRARRLQSLPCRREDETGLDRAYVDVLPGHPQQLRREFGHIMVDELVQLKRRAQAEGPPPLSQPMETGHSLHD